MTNNLSIQTVHGISHPFVVQQVGQKVGQTDEAEDHQPPTPQHYREAVSERLEKFHEWDQ